MASNLVNDDDRMWSEMAPEELAAALLEEYRRQPGRLELVDGVLWHRLAVSNLNALGNEISGLGTVRLRAANKLLIDQGQRRMTGLGRATVHYVLARGALPQNAQATTDEDDLLVQAAAEIASLRGQVAGLEQENAALRSQLDRWSTASDQLRTVLNTNPAKG